MATDDTCRFCFDGPDTNNPLVNPCKCIGSMKYVHVQCIKKWRLNTTNPEWHYKCQLCLSDFEVYLRWQKEDLPQAIPLLQVLTQSPILVSLVLSYLHLTILSLVPYFSLMNIENVSYLISNVGAADIKSPYLTLQQLYFTNVSYWLYLGMLSSTTCIYALTYYKSFWKYLKNKKMYAYLWMSCISNNGIFQSPLMTIIMTLFAAAVTFPCISPFVLCYIYMLSSIYETHLLIIHHMNIAAEIF